MQGLGSTEREPSSQASDRTWASGQLAPGAAPGKSVDPAVHIGPDDPAVVAARVPIVVQGRPFEGYWVRPAAPSPVPGVVVIPDRRGLTPYFEDVGRRLARGGLAAVVVPIPSSLAGAREPEAVGDREVQQQAVLSSALEFLRAQAGVKPDRIGALGFGEGGGQAWRWAQRESRLKALVVFYGDGLPADLERLQGVAVLVIDAGRDEGGPAQAVGSVEGAAAWARIVYPHAAPGFHDDTDPERYHPEAARAAWIRAMEWLGRHLGTENA